MIVILAALGPRSALLVGIAIPGSFLTTMLVLNTLGLTINIVVLFSLILVVGMLVDGATVVTELADRRLTAGEAPMQAYAGAAKRMAWPVAASTLTTLAVFFPLLFWPWSAPTLPMPSSAKGWSSSLRSSPRWRWCRSMRAATP